MRVSISIAMARMHIKHDLGTLKPPARPARSEQTQAPDTGDMRGLLGHCIVGSHEDVADLSGNAAPHRLGSQHVPIDNQVSQIPMLQHSEGISRGRGAPQEL